MNWSPQDMVSLGISHKAQNHFLESLAFGLNKIYGAHRLTSKTPGNQEPEMNARENPEAPANLSGGATQGAQASGAGERVDACPRGGWNRPLAAQFTLDSRSDSGSRRINAAQCGHPDSTAGENPAESAPSCPQCVGTGIDHDGHVCLDCWGLGIAPTEDLLNVGLDRLAVAVNNFDLTSEVGNTRRMQPLIKSKALVVNEGPATAPDTRAVPSEGDL